jgi:hypothetical protein
MAVLTDEEKVFVGNLKKKQILRMFSPKDTKQISSNGAVFITCGDGDIDYRKHYNSVVSDRPHTVSQFGGTMLTCRFYRGFKPYYDEYFVDQVFSGFKGKITTTLNLGHHYPCAMATEHHHCIEEVFYISYLVSKRWRTDLMERLNNRLPLKLHLRDERVFDFFHLKKINSRGKLEQNTYIFDPDLYAGHFL